MKKSLLFMSLLALLSFGFMSCSDDDDDNGGSSSKLAGKWHVEKIYDEDAWINAEDLHMDVFFVLNDDFTYTSYSFEYDGYHTLVLGSDDNETEYGTYSVKGKILTTYPDNDDESQFSYTLNGDNLTLTYYDGGEEEKFKLNLKRYSDDKFNLSLEKLKICGAWAFYGEESNDFMFFFPDGVFYSVTADKDWSWGKTPLPVCRYGNWEFSDGKLLVAIGENSITVEYELDENWMELTLKSPDSSKTYERESTSIYSNFLWE